MTNSLKKIFFTFFKLVVLILAYFYIYRKLSGVDLGTIEFKLQNIGYLFFVIVLMFFNWILESKKWQLLISPLEDICFSRSVKGVLIGLSLGLFTPNRIGEIGARPLVLPTYSRFKASLLTTIGSLLQFIVTVVLGFFAILYFFINGVKIEFLANFYLIIVFVILLIFVFFLGFKFLLKKNFKVFVVLKKLDSNIVIKSLLYSILRYFVFVSQFYLLLVVMDVKISFLKAVMAISAIFFILNSVPNFLIADLGLRSSLSLFFLGLYVNNTVALVISPVLLWIINVLLPSFIGYYYFLRLRIV